MGMPTRVACINEQACIGCVKCILACPVDAIIGATKLMHTVIAQECIGCALCIEPCPMDCITMIPISSDLLQLTKTERVQLTKRRYKARRLRYQIQAIQNVERLKKQKAALKMSLT